MTTLFCINATTNSTPGETQRLAELFGPYCPLPTTDRWFAHLTGMDLWAQNFPLIRVDTRNDSSCEIAVAVSQAHICAFGYTFLLECIFGFVLFMLAGAGLLRLQLSFPFSQWSRKIMFLLLLTTGAVRGILNAVACAKIMEVGMLINLVVPVSVIPLFNALIEFLDPSLGVISDQTAILTWFLQTTLPVNAASDLLVAFVDFTITSFWLDVLYHRLTRNPSAMALQSVLATALLATFAYLLQRDYNELISNHNFNTGNVYFRSLSFLSAVLILFGLLHMYVVALVVRTMYCFESVRSIPLFQTKRLRRNMMMVAVTGLLSAGCLLFRGITLVGRLCGNYTFFQGILSLENPAFTTIYFVVLMNVPCLAVMVAFGILTFKLQIVDDKELHPLVELAEARDVLVAAYDTQKSLNLFVDDENSGRKSRARSN
jgi:hypothetical protein